jgi:hypothetical protein
MQRQFALVKNITPAVWFSAVIMALPVVAAAQVAPLPSPIANTITLSFGVIGLASGESVRINVLNIVRTPPPLGIPLIPCRTELSFYDADGKLLKQKVVDSLGFGRADFLDLDRAEITATGRAAVAASVKVGSNQSFFCSIAPTIEVFDDATGRASTVLTNPLPQSVIVPRLLAAQ